jgi:Leucine-rich repeat (LRR) protein
MFKSIIELDLSDCGLKELDVETSIGKNIKLLDISNNFITKLPDNFLIIQGFDYFLNILS